MPDPLLSVDEYEFVTHVLQEGTQRYGPKPLERMAYAMAIAAGLGTLEIPGSPLQRPEFLFPGLTAQPWHEASNYSFSSTLEQGGEAIRNELATVLQTSRGFQPFHQDRGYFIPAGKWNAFYFRVGETWFEENRESCPETFRLLEGVPRLAEIAMFSSLDSGGHIAPHAGTWNCRITFHLGLVVPPACGLRVGSETRPWEMGKLLAFDDSFEHEAWNKSEYTRCVLLFDVWHPDLTDIEVELLEKMRSVAGLHDGSGMVERVRAERESAG